MSYELLKDCFSPRLGGWQNLNLKIEEEETLDKAIEKQWKGILCLLFLVVVSIPLWNSLNEGNYKSFLKEEILISGKVATEQKLNRNNVRYFVIRN